MLTDTQVKRFERDGYLAVDHLVDYDSGIAPVVREYQEALDNLCDGWVATGELDEPFSDLPFERRLVQVYRAGCAYAQPLDISLPNDRVAPETPMHAGPAVFGLMTHPDLLDAVESLIGGEIYSNPIQHVRIKPPREIIGADEKSSMLTATAWHQDQGVALPEADETNLVTCWVAITEATEQNGCLQVIPGSHRSDLELHCPGEKQIGIPDELIDQREAVPIPLNPGGVLFLHPLCKHASLENDSSVFRWSFDLRFNPIGEPTGRPFFPGFVARSRSNPENELRDADAWAGMWSDARERLARQNGLIAHRWSADAPLCS